MRVSPYGPRRRRRPPARVLIWRWLGVVVLAGLIVGGTLVAVRQMVGSVDPPSAAASTGPNPGGKARGTIAQAAPKRLTSTTSAPTPVTISIVGDTELGDTPLLPPAPAEYLDYVRGSLAAPIVFGNLEGTLTSSTGSKCGPGSTECFAFRAPPVYAQYLRHDGFTVVNSANNHSHDFGAQGVVDTSAALQAAGIAQTGFSGQIAIVHDGTTSVAFIGFAPYAGTNNMLDFAAAKTLIQKAGALADIVVVYMHAGAEGRQAGRPGDGPGRVLPW